MVMPDQMKSIYTIYVLDIRQGQLLDSQDLMKFLNLVNDTQYFI